MQPAKKSHEFTTYEKNLIRAKARQLSRAYGFTAQDVPDLEQELALDLIRRLPRFNPAKARRTTFASRVVERRCSTLLRNQYRQVRDPRRNGPSLNEAIDIGEDEAVERGDLVSQDDLDAMYGNERRRPNEAAAIRMDVEAIVVRLPKHLRKVAELLSSLTVTEAAQAIGMPRATFYEKRIAPLKTAFTALAPYVTASPTPIAHAG